MVAESVAMTMRDARRKIKVRSLTTSEVMAKALEPDDWGIFTVIIAGFVAILYTPYFFVMT